jgi:hypothetical protein
VVKKKKEVYHQGHKVTKKTKCISFLLRAP